MLAGNKENDEVERLADRGLIFAAAQRVDMTAHRLRMQLERIAAPRLVRFVCRERVFG